MGDFAGKAHEAARAVPTHFRLAAVAIVVAHPKIGTVGAFLEQKNPVRADAAMAIANSNDLLGLEAHFAGAIINHDEIVPCAVHLGESQHDVDLM